MPKFSIIIPLYNAERYIGQCLDSIAEQSYPDFEVIIVDDGSTDNGALIAKSMAEKDPRFVYYYKENGGVSSARNLGIDKAKGEWISFVDADDLLLPDALTTFANLCSDNDIEMAMGTYIEESYLLKECFKEARTFDLILSRDRIIELMFMPHLYNYQGSAWGKVYRRDLLNDNHIRFNTSIAINEDRLFCVEYICLITQRVRFTSFPVYKYIKRADGTMGSFSNSFKPTLLSDFDASLIMLDRVENGGFPKCVVKLGYDNVINSYDMVRHLMAAAHYSKTKEETAHLKQRTINRVGLLFFLWQRVRRFLSRQYYNIFRRKIYIR